MTNSSSSQSMRMPKRKYTVLSHTDMMEVAAKLSRKEASELAGAIGLSYEDGGRLLRVSSWLNTSEEEWTNLAGALVQAHAELVEDRDQSGVITL